ncbi:regucalcin-like [Papilio machaon]|uniref:regucalcin-like n=1 Tax=Papilio machaon TaxID=76193 RepID=UPI001E66614C|nr:regucalcin-like [Papilio machaon]
MVPTIKAVQTISFGEGPHWDVDEQVLYYVNFLDSTINKYNPATGQNTKTNIAQFPKTYTSFVIPIEGRKHHFLCGIKRDIVEIEWKGDNDKAVVLRTIASVENDRPENFLNDGKADRKGRLVTGTVSGNRDSETLDDMILPEKGSLYRIDSDGHVHKLDEKITIPNGLAWDAEGKTLYHVDTMDCIRRYDYNIETGHISNCQKLFVPNDHGIEGICDGLTIDTDDNLWVAVYQGGQILKIDGKTGEILQTVTMPTRDVTSLTFGGPNLDILYVTSSNMQWQRNEPVWGAAIYEVYGLCVRGYPAFKVQLNS